MFTIEQIKAAHGKVKSGADFPAYIQDIKNLGVSHYETFVGDGNTMYYGGGGHVENGARYQPLQVAGKCDPDQFRKDLKAHQQGKTSFPEFCNDCAKSGVDKWSISIKNMTCTYYDRAGNEVLVENIPG